MTVENPGGPDAASHGTSAPPPESGSLCILVVDDEPPARDAIAEALRDEGFEVVTAANGREAIELIDSRRPAVVLTDLDMPVQRGVDVVRHVRATLPSAAVYVFSAHTGLAMERESARAGAAGYLVKPLDLDDLVRRVGEAVAARSPEAT